MRMREWEGAAIALVCRSTSSKEEGRLAPASYFTKLLYPAVGRVFHELRVVHVRFANAGGRDLDELRAGRQFGDRRAPAVAHRRPQSAHQLMDHRWQHTLVGPTAFDAFRHQLLRVAFAFAILEITVRAPFLHGAQRPHAAIALVRTPLIELDLAGRLLGPGEQAAQDHARIRGSDSP